MRARQYKKLIKNLAVMPVKKHDVIYVGLKTHKVTREVVENLHQHIKEFFPNNKVMIIAADVEIGVIREK